jgi:hypothetical protein
MQVTRCRFWRLLSVLYKHCLYNIAVFKSHASSSQQMRVGTVHPLPHGRGSSHPQNHDRGTLWVGSERSSPVMQYS